MFKKKGTIVADQFKAIGAVVTINSQSIEVLERDDAGNVLKCRGTVTVTDGGAGYAKGCVYIKTDGSTATTFFVNEGSTSSCDFNAMETSASTVTGVTAGAGMTGGGTEGSLTLDVIAGNGVVVNADDVAVGAGRGITVRSGATDVGVNVYNNVGSTLTAGTLVNLSGFTTTNGITVTKADADAGVQATHVVLDAITNNTAGVVYPVGLATAQNTGGRTIGDLVYVDATTAGAFTFTAPTGADQMVQVVGVVRVVDASVGTIEFFPGHSRITKIARSQIQTDAINSGLIANGAVTPAKLSAMESLTATADGTGTGAMSGNAQHAEVTSAAATDQISLPASSSALIGKQFTLWVGGNGFELITPASSNETINGTDADGTNQVDIPANSLSRVTLAEAGRWILENIGSNGTVAAAITPDND